RSWRMAAAAVDTHYQLKDRAVTALRFVDSPATALHELQVQDAAQHLKTVQPRQVVPFFLPKPLLGAAVAIVGAVVLLVYRVGSSADEPLPPEPNPAAVELAKSLEDEVLKELEEAQKEHPELEKLTDKIRDKIEELKQPGVDEKEVLAKLSEM